LNRSYITKPSNLLPLPLDSSDQWLRFSFRPACSGGRYTKTKIFSRNGKETPISTVACEFDNTVRQVGLAARPIHDHNIANCANADPTYGKGVAGALDLAFGPSTMAAQ
jgi:catalase